jgi:hypothetical protein
MADRSDRQACIPNFKVHFESILGRVSLNLPKNAVDAHSISGVDASIGRQFLVPNPSAVSGSNYPEG